MSSHHSDSSHSSPVATSNNWIGTVLGTAAVLILMVFIMKQCGSGGSHKEEHAVSTHAEHGAEPAKETKATETTTENTAAFKVNLPGDISLLGNKGGIEDKLVAFLSSDWKALGADSLKKIWFDFDNLNFETGSAKITPESQTQINNIAAILKAFPAAKFKVGGYTDKTGDEAVNKKLSQERADATVAAIKAAGSSAGQLLAAEGYGSSFATVAATASEEERKKDRRISVSVRD